MDNKRIIIDFKTNEGYNYIKSIKKELSKRFKNDDAFVHIETNKDNPVPSIDKMELISKEYEAGRRTAYNSMYEINKILQNGVETDNVKPKKDNLRKYYHSNKMNTLICVNPSNTLTKDCIYYGYIHAKYIWQSDKYLSGYRLINDNGNIIFAESSRFKRQSKL